MEKERERESLNWHLLQTQKVAGKLRFPGCLVLAGLFRLASMCACLCVSSCDVWSARALGEGCWSERSECGEALRKKVAVLMNLSAAAAAAVAAAIAVAAAALSVTTRDAGEARGKAIA